MVQTIKLENGEIAVLDSDIRYSGAAPEPYTNERLVRKAINLPLTKQLVYYTDKKDPSSTVNVVWFRLAEMYNSLSRWYTIEIALETGAVVLIHSSYFIEMQRPSFVADMAHQEEYYARQEPWTLRFAK